MATLPNPAPTEKPAPPSPPEYRAAYDACPLCGHTIASHLCAADCRAYPNWHKPLPESLTWLRCTACAHIFTDSYYTKAGLDELFQLTHPAQRVADDLDRQRMLWSPVVERTLEILDQRGLSLLLPDGKAASLTWLDVGCGAGGLLFTADEFGFAATGLDLREEAVREIRALGYSAQQGEILGVTARLPLHVISMADVLEHIPYPVAVLRHAHRLLHAQGVLYLSLPNRDCSSWKQMDSRHANPYWAEIEHHHNFSRASLHSLLRACGFQPVRYSVSNRYIACMEIHSVKAQVLPALPANTAAILPEGAP